MYVSKWSSRSHTTMQHYIKMGKYVSYDATGNYSMVKKINKKICIQPV